MHNVQYVGTLLCTTDKQTNSVKNCQHFKNFKFLNSNITGVVTIHTIVSTDFGTINGK